MEPRATLFRAVAGESAGRSRVGGAPDLPGDFVWPVETMMVRPGLRGLFGFGARAAELAALPLPFLLQIDLAEVESDLPLPPRGLLSVFRRDGPQLGQLARVYWFEDASRLAPREPPGERYASLALMRERTGGFANGKVQVGGSPFLIQGPMEEGSALLAQIGSLDDPQMMWGDAGSLYLWMKESDIAARRFDKCRALMQCY